MLSLHPLGGSTEFKVHLHANKIFLTITKVCGGGCSCSKRVPKRGSAGGSGRLLLNFVFIFFSVTFFYITKLTLKIVLLILLVSMKQRTSSSIIATITQNIFKIHTLTFSEELVFPSLSLKNLLSLLSLLPTQSDLSKLRKIELRGVNSR